MDINPKRFFRGILALKKSWDEGIAAEGGIWEKVDAVCIGVGKQGGDADQILAEAVHRLLFGVLMTNTLIFVLKEKVIFVSNGKKCKLVKSFQPPKENNHGVKSFEIVELGKEQADIDAAIDKLITQLKDSEVKKVGALLKDKAIGTFAEGFNKKMEEAEFEMTDVSVGVQAVMMEKDPSEQSVMEKSSQIVSRVMKKSFIKNMENVFENEEKKTNDQIAKKIKEVFEKPKKLKLKFPCESDDLDAHFDPVVQSGGQYDIVPGQTVAKSAQFTSDVLICQLNAIYKDYNAQIARTYFVDPTESQKNVYNALKKCHDAVISNLVVGAVLCDVYDKALEVFKSEGGADYVDKLYGGGFGWGIGIENSIGTYAIKPNNTRFVTESMTFYVYTALEGVEAPEDKAKVKKYAIAIGNTVIVQSKGGAKILTNNDTEYDYDNVHYKLDDDDEDEGSGSDGSDDVEVMGETSGGKRRTRSSTKSKEQLELEKKQQSREEEMARRQDDLMKEKAQNALTGKDKKKKKKQNDEDEDDAPLINVYKSPNEYPDLKRNQICIDKMRETVFLPIGGHHVPFHISTIKGVAKIEEDRATMLRFTFYYPTGNKTFARDVPSAMRNVMTQFPALNYIKELGFRSKEVRNMNEQYRAIREMKKRVRARLKEQELEADIIQQQDLVILRQGAPVLGNVSMRPPIKKGKCFGNLSAHQNGFRFRTTTGDVFDLIYGNIAHWFFQDCKKELFVILHFRLKHPIKVGRTKTYDIQFYSEVAEASMALDKHRRNMNDIDEERQEELERKYRKQRNKAFLEFCKRCVRVAEDHNQTIGVDNEYDTPFRKLAFHGVHAKEMVTLMPTVHCLVNLTDSPFFVQALDDIEHVHFERVNNLTKNFDMVIIEKKHLVPGNGVPERITSIPMEKLDTIRMWLHDQGNITYTAGTSALQWKNVMDGVYDELERGIFWKSEDEDEEKKDIGWNFLRVEDVNESDESGGEESSDFGEEDASSESSAESDDWDVEEEESSEPASDDEDDDGASWDELEKEAARSDKKKDKREREEEQIERLTQKKKKKR